MDKDVVISWLRDGNEFKASELLQQCEIDYIYLDTLYSFDRQTAGTNLFEVKLRCSRQTHSQTKERYAKEVKQIEVALGHCMEQHGVYATEINWIADPALKTTKTSPHFDPQKAALLVDKISGIKDLMIAYVTGGREESQSPEYHDAYIDLDLVLDECKALNPNPHSSLESFWNFCTSEQLGTWASRRAYVNELYSELLIQAEKSKRSVATPRNWQKTDEVLGSSLAPIRRQWSKARHYSYSTVPDYENGVKEAINSVESIVKIAADKKSGTLGKVINELSLDPDIGKLISQCYGLTSNMASVRHGGIKESELSELEAEFFLEFAAISINYIKKKQELDS